MKKRSNEKCVSCSKNSKRGWLGDVLSEEKKIEKERCVFFSLSLGLHSPRRCSTSARGHRAISQH